MIKSLFPASYGIYAVLVATNQEPMAVQVLPVLFWGLDDRGEIVGLVARYQPHIVATLQSVSETGLRFDGYALLTDEQAHALKQKWETKGKENSNEQ